MGALSTLRNHARLICGHPPLLRWFLRNRLRCLTLTREMKRTDYVSLPPQGVSLRPTFSCNLRCKMCSFANGGDVLADPKDHLSLDTWKTIVDDLAQYGCYISLTGGEPLLYPHVADLVKHIKNRGLICIITTNGTLLERHAAKLMENAPDVLIVSIDGPPAVHDEMRGRQGTFELATKGVLEIQRLKKQTHQKRPFLIINSAITSLNYHESEAMIDIARDLGVDALNYQHQWSLTPKMLDAHNRKHGAEHYIPCNTGQIDLPKPNVEAIVEVVSRIRRRAKADSSKMYIHFHPELNDEDVRLWYENPHTWVKRRTPACAWITADILPNGDVEACTGLVCGNVTTEKFGDIWNNETYRKHRQRLVVHGGLPICSRCCAYFRRD